MDAKDYLLTKQELLLSNIWSFMNDANITEADKKATAVMIASHIIFSAEPDGPDGLEMFEMAKQEFIIRSWG
jgi:hypothetical protein